MRQETIFWIATTLILGTIFLLNACRPAPHIDIATDVEALRFSGDEAFGLQSTFVTQFPNRDSGRPNNHRAAAWLQAQFESYGLSCTLDAWEVVNYNRPVPLNNVVCTLPGESPREIVIMAHHDQSPRTIQGADNDGSGIGIMLHLAQIFAREPRPYTLVFVSTDGEEYGMLGSKRYVETHPDPGRIIAALSLDNLGKEFYAGMDLSPIGQFRGYGPLWLQIAARDAAAAAGNLPDIRIRPPLDQMLNQAVPVSFMDQGPLVAAGVPAVGFARLVPAEFVERHWETYHSPLDTLEVQSPAVIHGSGRIVEALIRQLFSMTSFPDESGPYLYFPDSDLVLRGGSLWLIFIVLVGLLFGGIFLGYVNVEGWLDILPHFLSLWLPLVGGVLLLYLFVAIGLMDTYHLYPATARDPAIFNPRRPAVILFVLGLAVLFVLGRRLARRFTPYLPHPAEIKSFAFLVIGLSATYILFRNPFSLLFFVPLLFWLGIRWRYGRRRITNVVLFLLGGLLLYLLLYFFGFVILRNDWAILWYLMMMVSIRMVGFVTLLAATAVLAAGLALVVPPPHSANNRKSSEPAPTHSQ